MALTPNHGRGDSVGHDELTTLRRDGGQLIENPWNDSGAHLDRYDVGSEPRALHRRDWVPSLPPVQVKQWTGLTLTQDPSK
jgi:hypothetical protein